MIANRQKTVHAAVSVLLALCIAPYYVFGNFIKAGSTTTPKPAATKSEPRMAGRLVTRGNLPVLVNGYGSYTGTTIFTGTTIITPVGVRATVQLAGVGSLDLSSNTTAVVDFGGDNVKGTLKHGCAILTTNPDIDGKLITPDGAVLSTDRATRSSVTVCSNEEPEENAANNQKPSTSDPWFGFSPSSTIAMIGAGTIFAANRHRGCCCCCCCRNPSPSSPNDCGCP